MPNEKDSTEKHLLNYADVFADVVNVLVFHGKEVIDPKDLVSTEARSVLTLHGKTREQERDVVKIWTKGNTKIALVGLENKTLQDKDMPLRVLAYDGASYKEQVNHHRSKNKELKEEKTYPCLSFVLYFGTTHWAKPTSLLECIEDIPEELKSFVNDYHIKVFEIAFLDDDTRKLFKSDFRHVVDYLHQVRTKEEYQASAQPVKYPAEVLQLMAAFTNNNRFLDVAYEIDTRGPTNMKDLIGNMLSDSERKGELKGEQRGALKSTVDCVVNLVRSTKGNTNLNDALEMLKVPADIRDAVAKQAKALLEA